MSEDTSWISVEDRLPTNNGRLLVFNTEYAADAVQEASFLHGQFLSADYYNIRYYGITHWMPLPNPPESK